MNKIIQNILAKIKTNPRINTNKTSPSKVQMKFQYQTGTDVDDVVDAILAAMLANQPRETDDFMLLLLPDFWLVSSLSFKIATLTIVVLNGDTIV